MRQKPFHGSEASGDDKNDPESQSITVRPPSEADIPSLAAHLSEMQAHYGRPVPDALATKAAVLACKPAVHIFDPRVLVAVIGETVVGSIVMNVTFPAAELTLSLYIRDLYIAKSARRRGVGRRLVIAANRLRAEQGFSALEWTTDSSNAAARRLYESSGARQMDRTYFNERRGLIQPVGTDRRMNTKGWTERGC
jgi:ribosomal protein S18 acetylase RimI-like enzyme